MLQGCWRLGPSTVTATGCETGHLLLDRGEPLIAVLFTFVLAAQVCLADLAMSTVLCYMLVNFIQWLQSSQLDCCGRSCL